VEEPVKKKIGELLVDEGVISEAQLEIALAEQARTGTKLGATLMALGLATEEEISTALGRQSGVQHVDLEQVRPTPDALALVAEELATEYELLPLRIEEDSLVVAMANPTDLVAIDRIQRYTDLFVRVVAAQRVQVRRAITRAYERTGGEELEGEIRDAVRSVETGDAQDAGVIALVDRIIEMAVSLESTDVHLEPDEKVQRVRFRVDGELRRGPTLPKELSSAVVARVKILADLDIAESRLPQDGKIRFDLRGHKIELRVSTFPSVLGESVVLRILDPSRAQKSLEVLGLSAEEREILTRAAKRPNGLILVTGPTGSGKPTPLYAVLRSITGSGRKVITLEDPVEYQLPLVTQCQINEKAGVTFLTGLRAILRHDPDVILVGEMRDAETASIAMRSALTGHLVLSTLHTNDAVGSIVRLQDMDVPPYLTGSCLLVAVAQRLVRVLCPQCRFECEPSEEELQAAGLEPGGKWWRASGCDACRGHGVAGRSALFEVLEITPPVARLVFVGAAADEIERVAREKGFVPFREAALRRARAGDISPEELARVSVGD
jgi:type IV pilus assembly protein PilB